MFEGLKIISHFTCTNMYSRLKNNSSAPLVLSVSFRNLAIKNINWHLPVAVTSKSLHSSTRMGRKVNNPEAYLDRNKEYSTQYPPLNLMQELIHYPHFSVFISRNHHFALWRFTYITKYFRLWHEKYSNAF